jgi:hypothetical protein
LFELLVAPALKVFHGWQGQVGAGMLVAIAQP